jgi:subtilisin family serine protease
VQRGSLRGAFGWSSRGGRFVLAGFALTLLALAGGGGVGAAPPARPASVPGDLIVGFKAGVSQSEQDAALAHAGASRAKSWGFIDAALAHVPEARRDAISKQLASDPRVRYAEPNYVVHADVIPNDPSFGVLYGLNNTGQAIQGAPGTPDADIDAPEAWGATTGNSNTIVAVVDTGVDYTHPDLAANMWTNPGEIPGNGIDDDGNGYVDDVHGYDFVNNDGDPMDDFATVYHGTHVSGTIGAAGDNNIGVAGVNWHVRIMALKFLNSSGSGSTDAAITAFSYARQMGAKLTSNSWGGGGFSQGLLDAINTNGAAGILTVAAAGNSSSDNDSSPSYPAGYDTPYVLGVAATDNNDNLASFSSYGRHTILLGAPGVNIYSTEAGNLYQYLSGTSMATPHVAGAAALLLSVFPSLGPLAIEAILGRTADPKPSLNGITISGGRLNVNNAVRCTGPRVMLLSPGDGEAAEVNQPISVELIAGNCGVGTPTVSVTANGANVPLTLQNGEYTGSYTPTSLGTVLFHAVATVGAASDTRDATVTVASNYACGPTSFSWDDPTLGTNLAALNGVDDGSTSASIPFPFTFYGSSYSTATVGTNGFLELGSSNGSTVWTNGGLPSAGVPNGLIAPFWDDLVGGSIYTNTLGSAPNRRFVVGWVNMFHFSGIGGSVAFEAALYEGTNEIRFEYQNTNFGNASYNSGADATSGVENTSGTLGVQNSLNQPVLTNGTAVSCVPGSSSTSPTITTTSLTDGTTGVAYSRSVTATGGTGSYAWSLFSGTLPPGLSITQGTPSATLAGTPTTVGTYNFTLQVADGASNTDTQSYTVDVRSPVSVTTASLPNGTAGQAYSAGLSATGGTGTYTWSWITTPPPWATLNASTGAITGTPPNAGSWSFTVTATDTGNPGRIGSSGLSITINASSAITITTPSPLPAGKVGTFYNQTLAGTGGTAAFYAWSVVGGALPSGLSLGPTTGTISGTPTKPGNFNFTVRLTDGTSTTSKAFSVKINKK